ncbi:G5 domain-containing protein [Plantactinospora sonchi]|uniref:G5 domain-containing protein n=1 Tax=Plantactinospora sonchi TaxID=1544735 RepID=A0ABU7S0M3_9ACTN
MTSQTPYEPSGHGYPTQPMPAVPYRPGYPAGPPVRRPGRLGPGQKAALIVGAPVLALLLCCGGLVAIGSGAEDPKQTAAGTSAGDARDPRAADSATAISSAPSDSGTPAGSAPTEPAEAGPQVTTPAANPTTPSAGPTVEKRTTTETRNIPFGERTVQDSSLAKGTRKVRTKGVPGRKTLTYEVTYTNGVQTGKRLVDEEVTRRPVTQVVAVGTRETRNCDPNYSGCVPVASDVDCAGGSGNGPAYVEGPVEVIGRDIYDLDRDGDGYGCDD